MYTPITITMLEGTSGTITGVLVGEDGVTPVPGSTLTTLTLTLYADDVDHTIINGRNAQSVLNVNGGAVDEAGRLTMTLSPADNAVVNPALPVERHIALFQWTWPTGKAGKAEIILAVPNLVYVP